MNIIIALLNNRLFVAAGMSWFIAQLMKIIIDIVKGKFTPDRLTGSGGMPSSHTATVSGLAASAAAFQGLSSPDFAITLILAFIVIYDALNVRYVAGLHSDILNAMREDDYKNGKKTYFDKPLKDKLGHTLPEVAAGLLIGIPVGILVGLFFPTFPL